LYNKCGNMQGVTLKKVVKLFSVVYVHPALSIEMCVTAIFNMLVKGQKVIKTSYICAFVGRE
jgi:hypothetical protein